MYVSILTLQVTLLVCLLSFGGVCQPIIALHSEFHLPIFVTLLSERLSLSQLPQCVTSLNLMTFTPLEGYRHFLQTFEIL
jgi:hypothetical protein